MSASRRPGIQVSFEKLHKDESPDPSPCTVLRLTPQRMGELSPGAALFACLEEVPECLGLCLSQVSADRSLQDGNL